MTGNLDTAAEALAAVLALDPQRRISSLNQYLDCDTKPHARSGCVDRRFGMMPKT